MRKEEAIVALSEGKVVSHRYFTAEEYMLEKDGLYCFEDGVKCSPKEFWSLRTDLTWESDWEIFNHRGRSMQ